MGLAAVQFVSYNTGEGLSASPREVRESAGINRAMKLIADRCIEPLLLDDIVAESGLSRFRFLRLFKRGDRTLPT